MAEVPVRPISRPGGVGMGLNPNVHNEDTLAYLEGYTPHIYTKEGKFLGGDLPQRVLEQYWSKLNHHLSLGNLDDRERRIQYYRSNLIDVYNIASIPKKHFTLQTLKTMSEVNRLEDLLLTKSMNTSGDRDRTLLQMVLSRSEQRSVWDETQGQQPKKKWYDPRRIVGKLL